MTINLPLLPLLPLLVLTRQFTVDRLLPLISAIADLNPINIKRLYLLNLKKEGFLNLPHTYRYASIKN